MKTLEVQETTKVLEALEIMNLEVLDKKVVQEVIEKVVNQLASIRSHNKLTSYFCIKGCLSYSCSNFLFVK